jgi:hypothetical protein
VLASAGLYPGGLVVRAVVVVTRARPLLLDLFCGAGGAGTGYARAGFEVVGVDIKPQPHYPYAFVLGDALEYVQSYGTDYDAIHASPPCQAYAPVTAWRGKQSDHPALIPATRRLLDGTQRPYVIENVPGSPVRADLLLCGSQFGLRVQRHRLFESSVPLPLWTYTCQHAKQLAFGHKQERAFADAMGCEWMTAREAREAIPPAYTRYIGAVLREAIAAPVARPEVNE